MLKTLALAATLGLAAATPGSAAVVLQDTFDYGPTSIMTMTGTNLGGNWVTTDGSVDYLAAGGYFGYLCQGTTGCIDLDGSNSNAGVFSTTASFAAGTYTLSVELLGSARGSTESVTITLGSWTTTLSGILPWANASQSFSFSTSTAGVLSFANAGGDNVGALLTGVKLEAADALPPAVPLPAAGVLLLGALGGLAGLRRRNRA